MKNHTSIVLIILVLVITNNLNAQSRNEKAQQKKEQKENIVRDSIDGVYIPCDLYDCFRQIDTFFPDSTKTIIKGMEEIEFSSNVHFGLGMWMRNNWGLWGGSRLSVYFNNLGIFHPDDMSGIIITTYYRYLKNEDIKLEEEIKYYKDYWKKINKKNIFVLVKKIYHNL